LLASSCTKTSYSVRSLVAGLNREARCVSGVGRSTRSLISLAKASAASLAVQLMAMATAYLMPFDAMASKRFNRACVFHSILIMAWAPAASG